MTAVLAPEAVSPATTARSAAPRIVQIVADGRPGGGSTVVLSLIAGLLKSGRASGVTLITETDSYVAQAGRALGCDVRTVDFFGGSKKAIGQLRAVLRDIDCDVIHAHGGRAAFYLAAAGFGRRLAPVCLTVHGYHFLRKPLLKRIAGALAERFAARLAGEVVFVCDYDRRLSRQWKLVPKGKPTRVIYNGIEPIRQSVNIAPENRDGRKVVYLGRLIFQKDPLLIASIARKLSDKGFTVTLIAGGQDETAVRAALEGTTVQVTGALPRQQALDTIGDAAFLLLPSRWEGFPMAVLEAMSLGLITVAANVSGLPEQIETGQNGVLIDRRDNADDYVSAIESLSADPVRRTAMANRGAALVRSRFRDDAMIDQYAQSYASLLARAPVPRAPVIA